MFGSMRLGLGLSPSKGGGAWWGDAAYFADFERGRYYKGSVVPQADAIGITRASVKLHRNDAGIYSEFSVDALARTNRGASFEPSVANEGRVGFDTWTTSSSGTTVTQNQPGVDGGATSAWLVECNANSQRQRNNTVPADTENRVYTAFVKKTTGTPTYFPALVIGYASGHSATARVVFNPTTGAFTNRSTNFCGIEDADDFWLVWVGLKNNGGTLCFQQFFAAYSADGGGTRNTGISGSQVAMWPQLQIGTKPSTPVLSVSSTVTRSADVPTIKLPAGDAADMRLVLANRAQQLIEAVPGGDYSLAPASLLHHEVEAIIWPASRPALWDDFTRADGALGDAPSGQTWVQEPDTTSTIELATISGNKLVTPDSGEASTKSYNFATVDGGRTMSRMLAKVAFTNATTNGGLVLISTAAATVASIIANSVHILFADASASVQMFYESGTVTLETVTYAFPLLRDGATVYTVGWELIGDTLFVQFPDGHVRGYTDARWAEVVGPVACIEPAWLTGLCRAEVHYAEAA